MSPSLSLPPELPSLPVLVVEPHLDDAVLSAFALARSGASVLTVFDGEPDPPVSTSWDAVCSLPDSTAAMALRRSESDEAMRRIGCARRSVGLIDLQYLDGPRPHSDAEAIGSAVRAWLADVGEGIVAVPAGAGRAQAPPGESVDSPHGIRTRLRAVLGAPGGAGRRRLRALVGPPGRLVLNARATWIARNTPPAVHADHLFVRDALVPFHDVATLVLYEDLPYLWGASADGQVADLVARHGLRSTQISAELDRVDKAQCVAAYETQVGRLYSPWGRLDSAEGLPATERYWLLDG